MRTVAQIHRQVTGVKEGGLRDWLEYEKSEHQVYCANHLKNQLMPKDFLEWLNEKYPENVEAKTIEAIDDNVKAEQPEVKKRKLSIPEIKAHILNMPPIVTYGIGIIAVSTIIFVGYKMFNKNK